MMIDDAAQAKPPGCFVEANADGTFDAVFNRDKASSVHCWVGKHRTSNSKKTNKTGLLKIKGPCFLPTQVDCALPAGQAAHKVGHATSTVSMSLALDGSDAQLARITLSVPDTAAHWFGVGLNASTMQGTYAIVVDGAGKISEHTLSKHAPGALLPASASLKVLSAVRANGVRTVVLQRALKGDTPSHYSVRPPLAPFPPRFLLVLFA